MLQLSNTMHDQPVMSLRTGNAIALAMRPIINPANLKIAGFFCRDYEQKNHLLILLNQDIREIVPKGFIVNDHEVLAEPEDLVRIRDLIDADFSLIGKSVETTSHQKLGKIDDYAVDNQGLFIQKLYATPSLLRSLSGGQFSIDRSQIIEITPKKVVIKDMLQPVRAGLAAEVTAPMRRRPLRQAVIRPAQTKQS